MFGTYIYPLILAIVAGMLLLWIGTYLARNYVFSPRVKCVDLSLNGKTRRLSGRIVGNVGVDDNTLFFNGRDAYVNCGKQTLSLPIKLGLDFNIGKQNESWATLLGWNEVTKPNNGIQIAVVDKKITCRIGDRLAGDIPSIQEIENDNEWHHLEVSRTGNKLVLFLDGKKNEKEANDQGLNNEEKDLTIGKSFLEEYFKGTIRNLRIGRPDQSMS
jgi:hypothetical protein